MKNIGFFVAATLLSVGVFAQDFQSWQKETAQGYGECRFSGASASVLGRVGQDEIKKTKDCVEAKIEKAKEGYATLQPKLKGAIAAPFKDYYAAWIGGMRALPALLLEENSRASTSAQATNQRLSELWARFEIEAGL